MPNRQRAARGVGRASTTLDETRRFLTHYGGIEARVSPCARFPSNCGRKERAARISGPPMLYLVATPIGNLGDIS
ncbi:MAG TPA: hypothetical protein VF725_11130, partial [Ktedonobacterales bacterium]